MNHVALKALVLGGIAFNANPLTLTLDQATKKATVRGRTKTKGASVNLGAVGFGVDADTSDADPRIGPEIVITDGKLAAFALPLTSLASAPFTFTNRGSDTNGHMKAEFSPDTGEFKVTGTSQKLVRDGSISGISVSTTNKFRADVGLSSQIVPVGSITQVGDVGHYDDRDAFGRLVKVVSGVLFDDRLARSVSAVPPSTPLYITPKAGSTVVTGIQFSTTDATK